MNSLQPLPVPTEQDLALIDKCENAARIRRLLELAMVRAIVRVLLATGKPVRVSGVDDEVDEEAQILLSDSTDEGAIVEAVAGVDECMLYVGECWVYLIFGNNGWDVMNDCTLELWDAMAPVNTLAEQLREWV
jgi:hypothetical protein